MDPKILLQRCEALLRSAVGRGLVDERDFRTNKQSNMCEKLNLLSMIPEELSESVFDGEAVLQQYGGMSKTRLIEWGNRSVRSQFEELEQVVCEE
jgi:hypothetical protein